MLPCMAPPRRQACALQIPILIIEVERDLTIYGEEVKFGGGKTIRDGMGQSQVTRAGGAVDTVITNALIVDHSGIYKADVALKDGLILPSARLAILTPSQALISSSAREPRVIAGEGDRYGGRYGQPHPLYLPPADGRVLTLRRDHLLWRRHRASPWNPCHNLHTRRLGTLAACCSPLTAFQ